MVTAQGVKAAQQYFEASKGGYIDVHAWRFTPQSFREISSLLCELGLSPLKPARIYDTPKPLFEFAAVLVKE